MHNKRKAYIQNFGVVNGLGARQDQIRDNLYANHSVGLTKIDQLYSGRSGMIVECPKALPSIDHLDAPQSHYHQLIYTAFLQIQDDVATAIAKFGAQRVAVIIGTTASGTSDGERYRAAQGENYHLDADYDLAIEDLNSGADFLKTISGARGISFTVSTACTSSAKAMIAAKKLIETGLADAVISGGADSNALMAINGFDSLDSLSSEHCLPFSKNRCGINIGEGAALCLLTKSPSYYRLAGVGESADGYHISSPDPTGAGAVIAMQQALNDAGLEPRDIGYVNAHGTATPLNDAMESKAIAEVFGEHQVLVSSTKPLTGHTLGAASAQELALCWMMLQNPEQAIPKQLNDGEFDPDLPVLNWADGEQRCHSKAMMSNSFAFGGSNTCLIITRE